VALGHLADDGQPETGAGDAAGRRRPVETVEDQGQVGRGDARAVIAHGELAGPQAYLDLGAGRAELGRVVQQVAHRDLKAVGAAGHRPRLKLRREDGMGPVPAGSRQAGLDDLV